MVPCFAPNIAESIGVITTLSCVKNADRALAVVNNPILIRACVAKLKNASSKAYIQNVDDIDNNDDDVASDGVVVAAALVVVNADVSISLMLSLSLLLVLVLLGRARITNGNKHKTDIHPLVVDKTLAVGGPGRPYTILNATDNEPYINATDNNNSRALLVDNNAVDDVCDIVGSDGGGDIVADEVELEEDVSIVSRDDTSRRGEPSSVAVLSPPLSCREFMATEIVKLNSIPIYTGIG